MQYNILTCSASKQNSTWMVEVGERQLRGLHAATQSGHGHHFPPMVAQFGHVLLSFAHRQAGLLHLHPQSKVENLNKKNIEQYYYLK